MASNVQKTPFVKSLNNFARSAAQSIVQLLGKSLPASVVDIDPTNTIVTIQFQVQSVYTLPQVTCPVFGPQYLRYPIQKGDLGVAFAADAYLGGVDGLGGGTASLTQQANLSALVFFPVGNSNFSATDNANAVVLYGPDGAIIRDTASKAVATINPNEITLTCGGKTLTINASGITLDGVLWESHVHSVPSGGNTGPPYNL